MYQPRYFVKHSSNNKEQLTKRVNFINILGAAFMRADP